MKNKLFGISFFLQFGCPGVQSQSDVYKAGPAAAGRAGGRHRFSECLYCLVDFAKPNDLLSPTIEITGKTEVRQQHSVPHSENTQARFPPKTSLFQRIETLYGVTMLRHMKTDCSCALLPLTGDMATQACLFRCGRQILHTKIPTCDSQLNRSVRSFRRRLPCFCKNRRIRLRKNLTGRRTLPANQVVLSTFPPPYKSYLSPAQTHEAKNTTKTTAIRMTCSPAS